MLNINKLIMEAMLAKSPELPVLKEIKAKFLNYAKSPEGVKKPIDDSIEISIINKIKNEHLETLSFIKDKESDKAKEENFFIKTLEKFLPAEATPEEIREEAGKIVIPGDKKGMGMYIKTLKSKFPTSDGKLISDIVKELIG